MSAAALSEASLSAAAFSAPILSPGLLVLDLLEALSDPDCAPEPELALLIEELEPCFEAEFCEFEFAGVDLEEPSSALPFSAVRSSDFRSLAPLMRPVLSISCLNCFTHRFLWVSRRVVDCCFLQTVMDNTGGMTLDAMD